MEGHLRYFRSLGKTWKTMSWKLSFPKAMRTFRAMSLVVKVDPSSSVVRLYRFHLCVNSEISGSRVHGTQWVSKNQRKWYVRFREKTDENFETPKWSVGHLEQPTLICLFQLGQHLGACNPKIKSKTTELSKFQAQITFFRRGDSGHLIKDVWRKNVVELPRRACEDNTNRFEGLNLNCFFELQRFCNH